MNHEEKTTELELPSSAAAATARDNNVVRVDFTLSGDSLQKRGAQKPTRPDLRPMPPPPQPEAHASWVSDIDIRSPWVLRLLTVVFVMILSMLVL